MEENKSSKRNSLIIGLVAILVLIIGASYAYFAVGTSNLFGTTTISATADSVGTVTLSNINSTLYMDLTAADMMKKTGVTNYRGRYCTLLDVGTQTCEFYSGWAVYDDEDACLDALEEHDVYECEPVNGDVDVHYYATSEGKAWNDDDFLMNSIAVATVSPQDDTNYYLCNYTLSISHTGTNDMYTRFNTNYTNKSAGQIILKINDTEYDWNNGFPSTYSGSFIIHETEEYVDAGLVFINKKNIDQTHLAGTDIALTLQATSFSCTALEISNGYYNASTWNDGDPTIANSPGSMNYYVKQYINNDNVIDNEICAVVGSTTVCMPYNAGENYQTYGTQLTTAGSTCADNNEGKYVCTYGNLSIEIDIFENNSVTISNGEESYCSLADSDVWCETYETTPDPGNGSR